MLSVHVAKLSVVLQKKKRKIKQQLEIHISVIYLKEREAALFGLTKQENKI